MSSKSKKYQPYLIVLWTLFSIPYLTLILLFILLRTGNLGFVPSFEDLENPKNNLASVVYSRDGEVMGKFFLENRTYVDFEELSPNIVQAVLATEDIRFHRHSGIDARGLARVIVKTIILGQEEAGGGSTITQQLAKNLYPRDTTYYFWRLQRLFHLGIAKFKEWNTAVKLERNYTKDELLVMYLNTVPFGHNAYGIKSAAKTFFNTTPDSLKIEEAAVLVGLLQAPTRYSPVKNPERSTMRRNVVLGQLKKYGFINEESYDSLVTVPIELEYKMQDHTRGLATYFREFLRLTFTADEPERNEYFNYRSYQEDSVRWFTNPLYGWVNKNQKPDGSTYNLYKDGLKIYTTIDSRMQAYAEGAMKKHLSENLQPAFMAEKKGRPHAPFSRDVSRQDIDRIIQRSVRNSERYRVMRRQGLSMDSIMAVFKTPVETKLFSWEGDIDTVISPIDSIWYTKHFLRAGFMAMEPQSGHVRAYVGGIDFRYFKYDHVTQGARQVGSTVKPFLYTLAMQEGYSPCYMVPNVRQIFKDNDSIWSPRNAGPSDFDGKEVTLKWGLANSVNNISAWLIKRFHPRAVVDIVKKMGVKSDIMAVNSVMYGTSDIKLSEMVGAYNTFVNKGVYIEPLYVTRVEDKNGNLLSTFSPEQIEAISDQTAYLMINLLQSVVDAGTARRLRYLFEFQGAMAGKTGTTQNQSDGWFMGLTPNLVAGTWVGGEDRSIHFDGLGLGSGTNMALPVFGYFMQDVYADSTLNITEEDHFEAPPNFDVDINCDVYGNRLNESGVIRYDYDEDDFR